MIKRSANKSRSTPDAGMTEKEIDENIEESFPASDPPSWTPATTKGKSRKGKRAPSSRKRI